MSDSTSFRYHAEFARMAAFHGAYRNPRGARATLDQDSMLGGLTGCSQLEDGMAAAGTARNFCSCRFFYPDTISL